MKKKLVFLTGAGVSAESGLPTFRNAVDGLWENHDIDDVCTAEAIERNPDLVHRFYNELRTKYTDAQPNQAHKLIAELEKNFEVYVITQNVDGLHEAAGSSNVLHLHGEIMKCRDINDTDLIFDIPENADGELCTYPGMKINGHEIRPHIVFFHEDVPNIAKAAQLVGEADIVVVIGTSMNVYPAAGLIDFCKPDAEIFYIDPHPNINPTLYPQVKTIMEPATKGMKNIISMLE